MMDVSVGVMRAKRKRGRPRKDSNLCREGSLQSPENASLMKSHQHQGGAAELLYPKECSDEGMVGSMVYGVVEGSFDAGYLISVRIGNNMAPFRGVVFQPRKVVAVTAANDVAPQAVMYERREMQVPVYASPNMSQVQAEMAKQQAIPDKKVQLPPYPRGNLRMVEEDEVMQAFEVSTSASKGQEEIIDELRLQEMNRTSTTDPPPHNLFYNQSNLFSDELGREGADSSSISKSKSPNLNLDLAFKNPNIGYHQALVEGNPLLLPPDLMPDHEPLDFIMDRPKTPTAAVLGKAINNEPYKLELATPHSPLNTRIADMDFVIQQPPHANQ